MKLETELKLSYYREIARIDEKRNIKLVQHTESGKVFVLKSLHVFDLKVFTYLKENPPKGVPKIIELIEDEEKIHVVEEYVSGNTLLELQQDRGPFSEHEAAGYISQLCDILRTLHQQNPPIVHRDIKPSNLLVTYDGRLILIDFNTAKESEGDKGHDTVLIGTAGYAAPEQYGFSESKPTADIYAIGVLLNELLTGCLPGQKEYKGRLSKIIQKCIHIDPEQRFQSVDELQQALNEALHPENARLKSIQSWLPPGIRNKNPFVKFASFVGYLLLIIISMSLEFENASSDELIFNRIVFLLLFLSEILLIGNYGNIWSHLPLARNSNRLVKAGGIVLWAFVLLICWAIIIGSFNF